MRTRLTTTAAILAALCAALPVTAAADDVWITLGRREAERLGVALAGKQRPDVLVIEAAGEPSVARVPEDSLPLLSQVVHESLHQCGGFMAHPSREAAYAAAQRDRELARQPVETSIAYTIDNTAVAQALIGNVQESQVRGTISTLAAYFTRYHNCASGAQSAAWIESLWRGYATGRSDVTVETVAHTGYTTKQPSVILTITGTDLPSEVVVLGAHQDSILSAGNNCSTSRSPGADDDASGIATISEVLRVALVNGYRPRRTVKFMAYAAEEVGLRGSQQIALQHRTANVDVVGVLQLDMTNYKGPSTDIALINDRTNATQNAFIGQLVDTYLPGVARTETTCGYGCSDHSSWNSQGYPASFPFEALFGEDSPFIHSSSDTLAQSGDNANHALKFTRLAAAYLAEVGKGTLGTAAPPRAEDFDGDGRSDLVVRNDASGQTYVWLMNGGSITSFAAITPSTDPAWKHVLGADFDGDGKGDLVVRNATTGQAYVWFMNGGVVRSYADITPSTDPAWAHALSGDFDGDGRVDLLVRDSISNDVYIWRMDGPTVLAATFLTNVPASWQPYVADIDGDGKADIVWFNASTREVYATTAVTTVPVYTLIETLEANMTLVRLP